LRVLLVSGIWPPDVGGPASHAPEVAAFLRGRGHEVEAVITADAEPESAGFPIHWVARSLPPGVRHAQGVRLVTVRARHVDVVYTTGMFGRSALGSRLARTPFVVKLTADGAYERAFRLGLWKGSLEEFQASPSLRTLPLRLARDSDVRRAAHVVTPSAYLRELALGWGVPPERVSVLPNPAPPLPELRPRDELRAEFGQLLKGVPADRVICYCGSGVTSAEMVFAMEQAGLPGARLYPGSWSEWCSDPTRPVATGE
jgi:glycosyltransferase involved in cell wall biosynthesis